MGYAPNGAPYNSVGANPFYDTYSHTVGGAGIVLEPSGNELHERTLNPKLQRLGGETEYELNFYIKSGGSKTGINPVPDWIELDERNDKPIFQLQNNPLIKVNAPVKWHTNPRSQKGPTIFDTQEEPGATGGYRLAEYPTGVVNNDDIMVWENRQMD